MPLDTAKRNMLVAHHAAYERELWDYVVPFWRRYSLDREHGGYHTCLDRDGYVYDTDKFCWMQARQVWCLSHLYNRYGKQDESLLAEAKLGLDFLLGHFRDENGDFYFSTDDEGRPTVVPYNIYSDCFATMALAEYGSATGQQTYLDMAKHTYRRIQERKDKPKGKWTKTLPSGRAFHAFGFSMIQVNMAQILKRFDENPVYERIINQEIATIVKHHIKTDKQIVYERVSLDGKTYNCMENRLLCPGHACEVIWFLAKSAAEKQDGKLIDLLADAYLWTVERGWDRKYGGIFYYQDAEDRPTEKIEANMKLWWVHAEALYAALYLFQLTGREDLWDWYRRLYEYTFSLFPDHAYGEWYGYLERDGSVAKTLKGGKWKGMFHVPRMLVEASATTKELLE